MEGNRDEFDEAKYAQDGRMMSMDQLEQLDAVDGVDQLDEAVDAFANVGQGLEGDSRTEMLNYWQQAIDEIEHIAEDGTGHECFKSTALPLARIKKVMKTDSEVRMISAEAPILFAKGCDIFITELTMRAWIHAEENKRRTLQRSDIATAIQKSDVFDFLIDIVPREEAQQRKASHHRAPHSEGGNISNDPHTSQHPAGRQPREMHYVGDSRSVNAPQMHNMPMGSGGPYVPPPGQAPNGMPGGSSMPEGGLPPQQFAQFDARFAQFPQQFAGAVPAPPMPQFGQFAPQFAGGQYIPPPGVPASLASPHQIPSDVRQSPPTRPLDTARPDALGAQIDAQALRAPPEPERRGSPHAPPPPQTQQQEQPERPPQESQERRASPQLQAAPPPPPPGQSQAASQAASPSHAPGQSQGQGQGQGQTTSHAPDANQAANQAASPAQAQAEAQGAGASPQLSKAPARYDAEFQYAPAYGEAVDVAFGPSY